MKTNQSGSSWWLAIGVGLALAIIFLDQTGLAVALPSIQQTFKLSNSNTQWVINTYLLALSSGMLIGGKLGDNYGHRLIFFIGIVTFSITSLLCAFSSTGIFLICTRVFQGLGGSLMLPSTTTILFNTFSEQQRAKAVAIYIGLVGIFSSLGPLLGGVLTEFWGWRAVFWTNIPVSLTAIFLITRFAARQEKKDHSSLDYIGFLLTTLFMCGLVLGIMQAPHWGWFSLQTLGTLLVSLFSLFIYLIWQKRIENPLVDLSVFKNHSFSLANVILFFLQIVNVALFFWSIFFQNVLHHSPLITGLLLLPATLPIIIMAPMSVYLRNKYGNFFPPLIGSFCMGTGLLTIAIGAPLASYTFLWPGFLLYGLGYPLMSSGLRAFAVQTISTQEMGMANAILGCMRQLGASLGLAVLVSFSTFVNWRQLHISLANAHSTISNLSVSDVDQLILEPTTRLQKHFSFTFPQIATLHSLAEKAYTFAFSAIMYLSAFITLLMIAIIFFTRKSYPPPFSLTPPE